MPRFQVRPPTAGESVVDPTSCLVALSPFASFAQRRCISCSRSDRRLPALAAAQGRLEFQRSYINPFPNGDRYRVVVLGDSLGDGLWSGLYRAFEEDTKLEIVNSSKPSTGFARPD